MASHSEFGAFTTAAEVARKFGQHIKDKTGKHISRLSFISSTDGLAFQL